MKTSIFIISLFPFLLAKSQEQKSSIFLMAGISKSSKNLKTGHSLSIGFKNKLTSKINIILEGSNYAYTEPPINIASFYIASNKKITDNLLCLDISYEVLKKSNLIIEPYIGLGYLIKTVNYSFKQRIPANIEETQIRQLTFSDYFLPVGIISCYKLNEKIDIIMNCRQNYNFSFETNSKSIQLGVNYTL